MRPGLNQHERAEKVSFKYQIVFFEKRLDHNFVFSKKWIMKKIEIANPKPFCIPEKTISEGKQIEQSLLGHMKGHQNKILHEKCPQPVFYLTIVITFCSLFSRI